MSKDLRKSAQQMSVSTQRTEFSPDTRRCQIIHGGEQNRSYLQHKACRQKEQKLVSTQDYVKYFTEVSRTDLSFNARHFWSEALVRKKNSCGCPHKTMSKDLRKSAQQMSVSTQRTAVSPDTRRCQIFHGGEQNRLYLQHKACRQKEQKLVWTQDYVKYFTEVSRTDLSLIQGELNRGACWQTPAVSV